MHEREYHCKPEDGHRRRRDHASNQGKYQDPLVPAKASRRAYSVIDTTTPAPTVLPPSRIANRCLSSIAIGVISSTSIAALSPGMIISVPAGNVHCPVTSVVRK